MERHSNISLVTFEIVIRVVRWNRCGAPEHGDARVSTEPSLTETSSAEKDDRLASLFMLRDYSADALGHRSAPH